MEKSLFGTSGIRGDAKTLFTNQFCFDIASSFSEFLKKNNLLGPIAIANDPRESSPQIKSYLFDGLGNSGVALFDEGVTPVPSINWLIKNTPITAGIMVTGSHIDPELNGVKFYAHEEEISEGDQKVIEAIYGSLAGKEKYKKSIIDIQMEDRARNLYSEMLLAKAKEKLPAWRVALDCANGAQSVVIPQLFVSLGLRVVQVNCDPQKEFIARDTDTDDKAELDDIKKVIKDEGCDFGVAFDGDGDRCVFLDEKAQFVQGEYTCSLIAKELAGESVVTTIAASQVVDTIGKTVARTKVGSPHVVGKMKEVGANFGFEQNGGAVFADTMYTRDGGHVAVSLMNIFSKFNGTFSEMVASLPKFYMFRTKVDYKWELEDKILSAAKKTFAGIKVEELDGLKIWVDQNTWILFRSSANAPEFRVFAESKVESRAKKLLADGLKLVRETVNAQP